MGFKISNFSVYLLNMNMLITIAYSALDKSPRIAGLAGGVGRGGGGNWEGGGLAGYRYLGYREG